MGEEMGGCGGDLGRRNLRIAHRRMDDGGKGAFG